MLRRRAPEQERRRERRPPVPGLCAAKYFDRVNSWRQTRGGAAAGRQADTWPVGYRATCRSQLGTD